MGSDSTLTSEDYNDSIDTQNLSYPQYMSLGGRSISDTSRVSPGTNSLDLSFSQFDLTSSQRVNRNNSAVQSFPDSIEGSSESRSGYPEPTNVSPTKTITKPTQDSVHDQHATLQLQLSTQPQTKSEQQRQRQVLDKLAKANINIEDLLLRVLGDQRNDSANVGLSDEERVQASQAIADLVKQTAKPTRSQSRRSPQGSTIGMQQCPYEDCNFFGRTCDLNKHKKRHEKPYGCTYPKCFKKFGAKSDWKRHENSQHFQQETFRCDLPSPSGKKCGQHYFRQTQLEKHLGQHQITSNDTLQATSARCKIGKNCQGSYWCGFCCSINKLQQKRNDAWDERFNHIAEHFENDTPKKNIDDWICVEENRTKRQLLEDMLSGKAERSVDAEGSCDDDELLDTYQVPSEQIAQASPLPVQKGVNKRSAPADFEKSGRHGRAPTPPKTIFWLCVSIYSCPKLT